MSCFAVAALCAILAVVSTLVLKYVSRAIPVVLIGLPVILAGLGAITAAAILTGLAMPGLVVGIVGTLAALGSGYAGHKLANSFFTDSLLH